MLPPIRSRGSAGSRFAGAGGSSAPGPSSCSSRCRSRRASSGALRAGGFILDDLESARAKALLQDELDTPPSAVVVVFHSPTATAGTPAFETAAAAAIARVAEAPASSGSCPTRSARGRSRPTATPPTTSSSCRSRPTIRRPPCPGSATGSPRRPGSRSSSPAVRRSTATSRRCRSPTSAAASSSPCPSPRSRCSLVFGSVVAAALPLAVGGAAVARRPRHDLRDRRPHPDEHLRPEPRHAPRARARRRLLAAAHEPVPGGAGARVRTTRPDERVAAAVEATVRTAGRAVFFSGLTVLLGLAGPRPVRVHDPALGRDRRRGRRPARGVAALTLLPALLAIVGHRVDALAIRRVVPRDDPDGPWARLARWVMRRPVAVLLPTLGLLFVARPAVPPRPVQRARTRRSSRPTSRRAPPSTASRTRSARASSRRSSLAIRTTGPATSPGERRRALRLLATAGGRPAGPPDRLASSTSTRA